MRTTPGRFDATLNNAVFVLMLAAYAFFTLYDLGARSLWLDEILVPLTARFPISYIIERSSTTDAHPPGYYLLVKAWSLLGEDDAFLRLPAVAAGFAAVLLCRRLATRLISAKAGLTAAAFLATNFLFITLSRQVRPYTLLVMLYLALMHGLFNFIRHSKQAWLVYVSAALLLNIHFSAFLYLLPVVLFLAFHPARLKELVAEHKILFSLSTLASAFPLYFFIQRAGEVSTTGSYAEVAESVFTNANYVLCASRELGPATVVFCAALLGGVAVLLKTSRAFGVFLLVYAATPVCLLVLARYAAYSNPWHYTYLLPAYAMALAACAEPFARRFRAAPLLCVLLLAAQAVPLLRQYWDNIYKDDPDSYRATARVVAQHAGAGSAHLFEDQTPFHAVARRLDQEQRRRFLSQDITLDTDAVTLTCVGDVCRKLLDGSVAGLDKQTGVFWAYIPRHPVLDISDEPRELDFPFDPLHYYATVSYSRGVQIDPNFGCKLMPTANDSPSSFGYVLENKGMRHPYTTCFLLRFDNKSRESVLTVEVSIDDGPKLTYFSLKGISSRQAASLCVVNPKHFKKMEFSVTMSCAPRTPRFPGGNLQTLKIKSLKAYFGCYQDAR